MGVPAQSRFVVLLIATFVASVGALCGIGGGLIAVPLLHYILGVPLKKSVATALCLVCSVAFSATLSELIHPEGAVVGSAVVALILGSLLGTQLGFVVAKRVQTSTLKAIFCIVFIAVGLRLLLNVGELQPPEQVAVQLRVMQMASIAGVGILAGVLVPLLGVGGGLVVVPSLLLLLPELGWHATRAASLGMAVVASSRSLYLYHHEGLIDWGLGRWCIGGGLLGAYLGVQWVHIEGAERVGQALLGLILLIASARFGLDALRERKERVGGGGANQEQGES